MQVERNTVVDNRGDKKPKKSKHTPDWLARIKSIKHIEIIAIIMVIVIAVIAYTFTVGGDKDVKAPVAEGETLTAELTSILSKIEGVGNVEILIVYNGGKKLEIASKTDRHTDTDIDGDRTTSTITEAITPIIVDGDKPLIIGEKRAEIDGVIVVADGGGLNMVKVEIMQALSTLLNIPFNKIQVFKAKG